MVRPSRTALILSGAFGFGAYQVGVMLALFGGRCPHTGGRPLALDSITGTSIGAVNGSLLLSAYTDNWYGAAKFVKDVYLTELASSPRSCNTGAIHIRGNPATVFQPECYRRSARSPVGMLLEDAADIGERLLERSEAFLRSPLTLQQRLFRFVDLSVFVSTTGFGDLLRRRVNAQRVKASSTALQVLATNWRTGDLQVFDPRELAPDVLLQAIEASAAVPGLVPPVVIDGEPYADGGLVMNTGLGPAIDAGADVLHVVYMDTAVSNMRMTPVQGTAETIYRMLAINLASMLNRDMEIAERINASLARRAATAERQTDMGSMVKKPARTYRPVSIHRYRAATDLGGAAGWISFDYHNLVSLIERGYRETMMHDCIASACILATQTAPSYA